VSADGAKAGSGGRATDPIPSLYLRIDIPYGTCDEEDEATTPSAAAALFEDLPRPEEVLPPRVLRQDIQQIAVPEVHGGID